MGITNELSQALKREEQDIVNVMALVGAMKHRLHTLREDEWVVFLKEVNDFCVIHSILVPDMDELVPRRLQLGGVRLTYFHHFCVEVFCQVIDLILEEINDRFNVVNSELLLAISCLSPKNCFEAFDHVKLLNLAKLYPSNFSAIDLVILEDQLQTYVYDVQNSSEFTSLRYIGSLAKKMVERAKYRVFPLVYRLICLAFDISCCDIIS